MRILSQDGRIDVPYKQCGFIVFFNELFSGNWDINANIGGNKSYKMAGYSTEAKARKAMEMLREQYARLCSLSTYLHGGMELFAKTISQKEAESFSVEYLNMNIFQFPADDEVEV